MAEKKTPRIRFEGFTEDWEQRKFGNIYKKSNEKNDGSFRYDKNISVATMQYNPGIRITKPEYFKTYYVLRLGDIAFEGHSNKEFQYGRFVENDIGDGIVSHVFAVFRPTMQYDLLYWKYAIHNECIMKEVLVRSTKSSTMMHDLVTEDFFNESIRTPKIKEQEKIGRYLDRVDNLITLHQRKCEKLKMFKKSMLEKMFPKNGEKVPEVRFEGFTDDWEQCELRSLTYKVQGNDGRMNLPTLTISAANGWLDQRERFSGIIAGKEQKNYTLLKKDQLSYNHGNSKLAKYGTVFSLKKYEEALVPRVYHSFGVNDKANADFIEYIFATKLPDIELGKLISSGARMDGLLNISYEEFVGIKVKKPTVKEQIDIASFFRKLDETITLHQRKVEKLQMIKKSMLDKMFV